MKIGEMNRRITFQRNERVKDNEGITSEEIVNHVTVWAKFEPLPIRFNESFKDASLISESYVKFTIRYRRDITPDMFILYDGIRYNIITVDDIKGLHKETHIMCRRLINGG